MQVSSCYAILTVLNSTMKALKLVALIALIFIFSGCAVTHYVSVPVEYSARTLLTADSASVLIINQFDLSKVKKSYNQRQLNVLRAGMRASFKYAETQLKQLANIKVTSLVDSSLTVDTLPMKDLTSAHHVNYVLALNSFSAGMEMGEIDQDIVEYDSHVELKFTLYTNDGALYKVLEGNINGPQSVTPNLGFFGNLIIHPGIGGKRNDIIAAAQNATQMALQDYLPYTITHTRPIYNDDWLQPAITEMNAGHYEKADTLLQVFITSKVAEIASKAAYMLSVVYEYQGDIESAIRMAQQSTAALKNTYADAILTELPTE